MFLTQLLQSCLLLTSRTVTRPCPVFLPLTFFSPLFLTPASSALSCYTVGATTTATTTSATTITTMLAATADVDLTVVAVVCAREGNRGGGRWSTQPRRLQGKTQSLIPHTARNERLAKGFEKGRHNNKMENTEIRSDQQLQTTIHQLESH